MIRIYGASDDLVEVSGVNLNAIGEDRQSGASNAGASDDEVGCYDSDVEITIGGADAGIVVTMDYGEPGVWSAKLRQIAEDVPCPWPVRIGPPGGGRHGSWGYSVAVEIDCPDETPIELRVIKRAPESELRERVDSLAKENIALAKRNVELVALEQSVARAMKAGAR